MERFAFYFRNAALSLLRERRRAIFAIFTVVVGVAAIVGLQLTADILESSLTTNVRALLRGDLAVSKPGLDERASFESQELDEVTAARRGRAVRRLHGPGHLLGLCRFRQI